MNDPRIGMRVPLKERIIWRSDNLRATNLPPSTQGAMVSIIKALRRLDKEVLDKQ